ncbi:hypothetical protein HBI23_199860 [Parastagonospora nodorum]|nr:hypothetical protein HBI47_127110 [Parastagonospora nodorum]KAH5641404.1 hypothetical protein HBI23_199860 [Parastagonospora nodorum]
MTLGLEALFEERLEVFPAESLTVASSKSGRAEDLIKALMREREDLQAQVQEQAATIEQLTRRLHPKPHSNALEQTETLNRLYRLEHENDVLRKEKDKLNENLRAAECETATLRSRLEDKSQKVKGANKKTKNAKQVAEKEGEKAKDAVQDKQRCAKAEKQMKQQRNEAKAALQEQLKAVDDLRSELATEQSGIIHLRETEGTHSDLTTVVIPMEFLIRRQDYVHVQDTLESNRISYVDRAKEWYEKWKVGQEEEEVRQVVGANYLNDEKKDKLYGDMIEAGFMATGAEHDGWRSMKGLK